jgi:PAS domain S-box-containing protein
VLTNKKFHGIWKNYRNARRIEDYPSDVFHVDGKRYLPHELPLSRAVIHGEKISSERIMYVKEDGSPVWVSVSAVPLFDQNGGLYGAVAIISDITERLSNEERTRELSEKISAQLSALEAIYVSAPVGLAVFDRSFRYVKINERLAEINGIPPEAHMGKTPWDIVPSLAPQAENLFRQILNTGEECWNVEFSGTTPNRPGQVRFWNEHWLPMKNAEGHIIGVNVVAEEITEQKNLTEKLRRSSEFFEHSAEKRTIELSETNKQLRAEIAKRKWYEQDLESTSKKFLEEAKRRKFLSARLVDTLERDRRDIAMYLHDEVGQLLTGLKMDIEKTQKETFNLPEFYKEKLCEFKIGVATILTCVKNASAQLRPHTLDTLGLLPALRSLFENIEKNTDLKIQFHTSAEWNTERDLSLTVYRIIQEALNNVVKHSLAKEVFVQMVQKNSMLYLTVEDDGVGFDYDAVKNDSLQHGPLGIMIMKERAVLVDGELTVESKIGKGTLVRAEIPL